MGISVDGEYDGFRDGFLLGRNDGIRDGCIVGWETEGIWLGNNIFGAQKERNINKFNISFVSELIINILNYFKTKENYWLCVG